MANVNPYDVNQPGKFDLSYAGFNDGFYCYRVVLDGQKGLDACMYEMEISQWLFDHTQGRWHMGNDFPYADHPKVKLFNPPGKDTFVLLETLADALMFEQEFPVMGLSPAMLA